MTRLGTFWEGLIVLILGVAIIIASALLKVPPLEEIGKAAAFSGLGYLGGGAAAGRSTAAGVRP